MGRPPDDGPGRRRDHQHRLHRRGLWRHDDVALRGRQGGGDQFHQNPRDGLGTEEHPRQLHRSGARGDGGLHGRAHQAGLERGQEGLRRRRQPGGHGALGQGRGDRLPLHLPGLRRLLLHDRRHHHHRRRAGPAAGRGVARAKAYSTSGDRVYSRRRRSRGFTRSHAMREAVVVASSRTPLAKSFRGSFNLTRPDDLAAHCIRDVLGKVPQLGSAEIEDVIMGCAQPNGPQGSNVARVATLRAGLPASVAATTVNRFCSSELQAIAMAAHQIILGGADAAIGGGLESITMMKRDSDPNPWVMERKPGIFMVMGDTAEVVAKRYKISRQTQDEYALLSQQRIARAQQDGFFKDEMAPMSVVRGIVDKKTGEIVGKEDYYVDKDECNRPDTTLDGLLALPPHFDKTSGQGSVTAGNSSQLSDGASATLLMSMDRAKALGVRPKLIFRGFAVAGCEPDEMGIGPVFAVPKLLKRTGLTMDDIDVWELNEAFASQVVYCRDTLGIPMEKLNPNGGSISIGHPFGMTGSRMVGTIANEMLRRKAKYGVVTMCIGGGQGAAGLFEACL